jgi:predicted transcriptional regulator
MDPHQPPFLKERVERRDAALEHLAQVIADFRADQTAVALARHEHQHRDETVEAVAPHQHAYARPLVELQDGKRKMIKRFLVDLE